MDGVICVYKPQNYTSFDVVAIMKKLCKTKKVGHGGTLDPLAEGVLPIFVGNATRAVDFMPSDDKKYIAGFKFGLTTDTQDITGRVLSETEGYVSWNKLVVFDRFVGEREQIPPMYSAVKKDGVRLYELARKGEVVERKSRKVHIKSITVDDYENNEGHITVECSKGTYVRTLIHDIGQEIGNGAVMTSLVRTKSGIFTIDMCHKLEDLQKGVFTEGNYFIEKKLISLDEVYKDYPKAYLDIKQTRLFSNGAVLDANRIKFDRVYTGLYRVYDCNGHLLSLAKIDTDHSLKVVQRFAPPEVLVAKGATSPQIDNIKKDLIDLNDIEIIK